MFLPPNEQSASQQDRRAFLLSATLQLASTAHVPGNCVRRDLHPRPALSVAFRIERSFLHIALTMRRVYHKHWQSRICVRIFWSCVNVLCARVKPSDAGACHVQGSMLFHRHA